MKIIYIYITYPGGAGTDPFFIGANMLNKSFELELSTLAICRDSVCILDIPSKSPSKRQRNIKISIFYL